MGCPGHLLSPTGGEVGGEDVAYHPFSSEMSSLPGQLTCLSVGELVCRGPLMYSPQVVMVAVRAAEGGRSTLYPLKVRVFGKDSSHMHAESLAGVYGEERTLCP